MFGHGDISGGGALVGLFLMVVSVLIATIVLVAIKVMRKTKNIVVGWLHKRNGN